METNEQVAKIAEDIEPDYIEAFIYSMCFDHELTKFLPVLGHM